MVSGGRNQIAHFLLPRLYASGAKVYAISRQGAADTKAQWLQWDLSSDSLSATEAQCLYHIAPLKLAIPLLKSQPQIKQIIAFSSTSRFSKTDSSSDKERTVANELAAGEAALIAYCQQAGINWTILRPTLIYGCGLDKNIYLVAQFIRRFSVFPLAFPAKGLRQPVHADDLAKACLQITANPQCFGQSYALSGGETLSYKQMIKRVFKALGKPALLLPLPLWLFKGLYQISSWLAPLRRFQTQLNPAMLERMNQDLVFEHQAAQRDFGYQPRGFYPDAASLNPPKKSPAQE